MTIGERIRELRQQKGLTQKQLGDKCEMADSAIRRYESDRGNPTLDTLKRIAEALEVSTFSLLDSTEYCEQSIINDLDKRFAHWVQKRFDSPNEFYNALFSEKVQLALLRDDLDKRLIDAYGRLNSDGKVKAVERIEELTEVLKYQVKPYTYFYYPSNSEDTVRENPPQEE